MQVKFKFVLMNSKQLLYFFTCRVTSRVCFIYAPIPRGFGAQKNQLLRLIEYISHMALLHNSQPLLCELCSIASLNFST